MDGRIATTSCLRTVATRWASGRAIRWSSTSRTFSDRNWLHHHGDVSFHSDALHMVERYRLIDADTLEINVTANDPQVLTGTWKAQTVKLVRAPFEHVMETSCENTETANLIDAASKDNYGRKK
jgi:hypothetical protein